MRIIHCADLHLDSKMNSLNDKIKAKERRDEILTTFVNMISYAEHNKVDAIIIAGDMFDTKNISARTRNQVINSILSHRTINFYYLKGNHDEDNFLSDIDEVPRNLKLFSDSWQTYTEAGGHVTISGLELSDDNSLSAAASLVLDNLKTNIVILHGQEAESVVKDKAEIISLKEYRNKGIDYLALGHVHGYKREQLDPRGVYCYSGCLEGRGFDECGDHGFVVIDIDEESGHISDEFISFAQRKLYTVEIDVSDCLTSADMVSRTTLELQKACCEASSLVKLVLKGGVDVECEKDPEYILSRFKNSYYYVKIYDETTLKINIEDYMLDATLKGEFVRRVYADSNLSDEERKIVIRYGLEALAGEEVR